MGNYRFKLSDWVPNAWLYKLKKLGGRVNRASRGRRRKREQAVQKSTSRSHAPATETGERAGAGADVNSVCIKIRPSNYVASKDRAEKHHPLSQYHARTVEETFRLNSPRKSIKNPSSTSSTKPVPSRAPNVCHRRSIRSSVPPETCRLDSSEKDSTIFPAITRESFNVTSKPNNWNTQYLELKQGNLLRQSRAGDSTPGLQRNKTRVRSPRLEKMRIQAARNGRAPDARRRKGFTESLVVVKSSSDPRRDFRESIMEMILANDLLELEGMKELLACYLSLNSIEYHGLIVEVFRKICAALHNAPAGSTASSVAFL